MDAAAEVNPRSVAGVWDRIGCSVVASYSKHWPVVFPQQMIFCDHLDLLGVRWTRPNGSDIAIDRRSEVAKLDALVGPTR